MLPSPVPPRVLVVDDDPGVRRMVEIVLDSEGLAVTAASDGERAMSRETARREAKRYAVTAASDGERAMSLLEVLDFDLVVLDLQMPVMDGRTFYRELRRAGYRIPVIVLSAYGARDAARELGAEAGMGKPFDIDDLIDLVNALLASPPREPA